MTSSSHAPAPPICPAKNNRERIKVNLAKLICDNLLWPVPTCPLNWALRNFPIDRFHQLQHPSVQNKSNANDIPLDEDHGHDGLEGWTQSGNMYVCI